MNKLIYLASPYSHKEDEIKYYRYLQALKYKCFKLNQGIHIYSPIVESHAIAERKLVKGDWQTWQAYDINMLSRCDEMHLLLLDGHENSVGANAEVEYAKKHNIPVKYIMSMNQDILILISANGQGAGKTWCKNKISDLIHIDNRDVFITLFEASFANSLKHTLIDWGFITKEQAFSPKGKQSQTDICVKDLKLGWKDKKENNILTTRELLQYFGSDVMRDCFMEDIWVRITAKNIQKRFSSKPAIIISDDVRFNNEQNIGHYIENDKLQIIKIFIKNDTIETSKHQSEGAIKENDCDIIVNNDMSKKFNDNIENMFKKHILPILYNYKEKETI